VRGAVELGGADALPYSVIQSPMVAEVEPLSDLRDVLERIGTMPSKRLVALLPAN
jgi:hypothetical protein